MTYNNTEFHTTLMIQHQISNLMSILTLFRVTYIHFGLASSFLLWLVSIFGDGSLPKITFKYAS